MRRRKGREASLERLLEEQRRRVSELELALERRAGRDPLTGLPSLGRLRDELEREVHRARRHGRALSVAVVDVDHFRDVNARGGYNAGDLVLREVAKMLEGATRSSDIVARTGSDEFVLVLPETDTLGALNAFERLMLEFEALEIGPISGVSVSIGVAALQNGESGMDLVAQAGQALDAARRQGGARALAIDPGEIAKSDDDAGREQAISALGVALLERDRYTGEHSESVLQMVEGVAQGLGIEAKEIERMKVAALLHDIGKVAIPDEILHKPAELNTEELQLMREHPAIGERILRAVTGMGSVARIVRHEHESFDGSGYPDGLAGAAIPIGSRIILACDAYHAMTSDRPYRDAMPHEDAVDQLLDNAGKQFDPEVVECLLGYLYGHRQSGARQSSGS